MRRLRTARQWTLQDLAVEGHERGELERELTPGEGVLVTFIKRMGITPEEAVVRLACEGRDLGEPADDGLEPADDGLGPADDGLTPAEAG